MDVNNPSLATAKWTLDLPKESRSFTIEHKGKVLRESNSLNTLGLSVEMDTASLTAFTN